MVWSDLDERLLEPFMKQYVLHLNFLEGHTWSCSGLTPGSMFKVWGGNIGCQGSNLSWLCISTLLTVLFLSLLPLSLKSIKSLMVEVLRYLISHQHFCTQGLWLIFLCVVLPSNPITQGPRVSTHSFCGLSPQK